MMADSMENPSADLKHIADSEFETALRRGFWRSVMSWFRQRNNKLLPFDEVRKALPIHGQYYAGLREIKLDKVVGSVARYNDFDRAFIPRQRHTRQRWINIDIAKLTDVSLPPIEVYKIGEIYFVKDGNHRVSVAREKGQIFIDAQVTEIVTTVPITESTDINALIREQERLEFFDKTQLALVRPEARVELSIPGQYGKLLEHISVHRWFMGERWQRPVTYPEAVAGWYDEVYLPLAKVIEDLKILKEFPNRTVSDLYLWVIEHLWFLRTQVQKDVTLTEAASHFAQEYSKKPLSRLSRLFGRLAEIMADQTAVEIGMLPEDLMIDGGEHQPKNEKSSEESDSPEDLKD
jgi:hypothetical protein